MNVERVIAELQKLPKEAVVMTWSGGLEVQVSDLEFREDSHQVWVY